MARYTSRSGHSSGDQSLGGDPGSVPLARCRSHLTLPVYDSNVGFRGVNLGVLPLDEPAFYNGDGGLLGFG